ncbi:hypothetical protein U9K52_08610 [Chryseobacterium sp. MHB01]|uniref:hypothetical protein n=1 Tax=Chryseobacterium sp. MHB01 TaxID=3109433 RepID=UPI002AFF269A|nr:hypothetical protein [Chryseobacterium sp. MHB01]MEA1848970.1 hypothetical protein [Chryseobacterium sp. MHB01]
MENTIYRLKGSEDTTMEISIVKTNYIEPFREKREVGIDLEKSGEKYFFSFDDVDDIQELINYLEKAKQYCEKFNSNTNPIGDGNS